MPREIFVWGWGDFHPKTGKQIHCICAVRSLAELMRITGATRSDLTYSGSKTGNARQIEIATAKPGKVFWKDANDYSKAAKYEEL
jgi:hypothetical protein